MQRHSAQRTPPSPPPPPLRATSGPCVAANGPPDPRALSQGTVRDRPPGARPHTTARHTRPALNPRPQLLGAPVTPPLPLRSFGALLPPFPQFCGL